MKLSQKARLLIIALYIALLFSVCRFLFGSWLPPNAEKGIWLYASLGHLLLGTLLLSPYFTKPADAVSDAVIAALVLPEIHAAVFELHIWWVLWIWKSIFVYYLFVIVVGSTSMVLRGNKSIWQEKLSNTSYVLSTELGETAVVFSLLFFFALAAFHRDSLRELATLTATWTVIVPLRLFENTAMLAEHLKEIWFDDVDYQSIAEACARKEPNLILLRRLGPSPLPFGQVLTMKHSHNGVLQHAMTIDEFQLADECWIRCLSIVGQFPSELDEKLLKAAVKTNVFKLDAIAERIAIDSAFQASRVYSHRDDLIGLVAPDTNITTLRFEVTRSDLDIGEGQLVEVAIGTKNVLYQIINGLTQEEILSQKSTYGFARGYAKKIGTWNASEKRFEHVRWIPNLNEPVFLRHAESATEDSSAVGFFPETSYPIAVDPQQLVTHNGAILGILGAGKTFLALELVERMLLANIKVIVLDLTNQYASHLQPYYDAAVEQPKIDALKAVGPPGKTNCRQNVAEGGSVGAFHAQFKNQLSAFMSDADARLRIYNPTAFEVWRQDSKLFSGVASMAQLTPTEIARIITEIGLELCSTTITETARLCIVYEEAHSLIPEWNAVASEGDKAATNGTAKAILQGRKYGLGCLVITQRTANVTKTILNQCNTIFALRVFDSTGMEFLRNYVGDDYSGVLSSLENRHAVIFGKASSCSDPVLVRLNDREKFLRLNRPNN